jgi:hypothetical protein
MCENPDQRDSGNWWLEQYSGFRVQRCWSIMSHEPQQTSHLFNSVCSMFGRGHQRTVPFSMVNCPVTEFLAIARRRHIQGSFCARTQEECLTTLVPHTRVLLDVSKSCCAHWPVLQHMPSRFAVKSVAGDQRLRTIDIILLFDSIVKGTNNASKLQLALCGQGASSNRGAHDPGMHRGG